MPPESRELSLSLFDTIKEFEANIPCKDLPAPRMSLSLVTGGCPRTAGRLVDHTQSWNHALLERRRKNTVENTLHV